MSIAEQRPGDSQGRTILIVDDNPANLEVIGEYLLNAGLRIMTARTGETGLKLARQDQPDLILLDVMLPGIDGFETCRRLKADERTQAIPIIFMTVMTRTEDKIKGFAVGSVDYIAKPFQQEEVLARIQMHLLLRRLQTNLEAQVQERTLELEEANTRLKAEIAEREQAEVALRKINRMFRILSDCNQAVIHSTEEAALLPEICRIIADRGSYPFVWVDLAEQQDAATIRPVAYAGHETDFLTTVIQTWTDSEQNWEPASTAMRSGDLCLVSTIQADPHFELWNETASRYGYQSCLALPLSGTDGILGVLNIYAAQEHAFEPEEIKLLIELAADLTYGLTALREQVEHLRAEEALRQSEKHFSTVFHTSPVAISISRVSDGHYIDLNEAHQAMFGYSREELLNGSAQSTNIWADPQARAAYDHIRHEQGGIRQFEFLFRRESGQIGTALLSSEQIELDGERCSIAFTLDITERKSIEEKLRRLNIELEQRVEEGIAEVRHQQAQLNAIVDSMGEGMVYIEQRHIRYVNRTFAALLGYAAEDLIGQHHAILFGLSEQDADENGIEDRLGVLARASPGQVVRREARLMRKAGSAFDAAFTLTFIADIDGLVAVMRDITEEKKLQKQKEAFVANASHELRTPLTNIKTRLYLLKRQPELLRDHLAVMESVVNWMTVLVEDLLDLSRFERGVIPVERKNVVLQHILLGAIQTQRPEAERKGIHLTLDMPPEQLYVYADSHRLMQVMVNLIVNAINYTSLGGAVAVRLGIENDDAVIQVHDTGIGISPDNLLRIFEPFFRANESAIRGTGLGLSISKAIIEAHHGSLTVESRIGEGSTFIVRVALSKKTIAMQK